MMVSVGVLLICNPLLVVAAFVILVGAVVEDIPTVVRICGALLALQFLAVGLVALLYRWCYERAPVRGAALLVALVVSLAALNNPPLLAALLHGPSGVNQVRGVGESLGLFLIKAGGLVSLASAGCMLLLSLVELPLRWFQGQEESFSDGALRVLRSIGVLLCIVVASSILTGEGIQGLLGLLARAIS
jgi:hypothetical protein